MSAAEGASEASEASEASKQVSGAGERANGQASGPVLTSLFLFVPDHSGVAQIDLGTTRQLTCFRGIVFRGICCMYVQVSSLGQRGHD